MSRVITANVVAAPVTEKDVEARVNGFLGRWHIIDVAGLFSRCGFQNPHAYSSDIPPTAELAALEYPIHISRVRAGKSYTWGVGLNKTPVDPDARVYGHWYAIDRPEQKLIVDADTGWGRNITYYAKYHVFFPSNGGGPVLCVNPIQCTTIDREEVPRLQTLFREQLAGMDANMEAGNGNAHELREKRRRVRWNLKALSYNVPTAFCFKDRWQSLAVLGVELARDLGIRRIAFPSDDILDEWEEYHRQSEGRKIHLGKVKDFYTKVRDFVTSGQHGVEVLKFDRHMNFTPNDRKMG